MRHLFCTLTLLFSALFVYAQGSLSLGLLAERQFPAVSLTKSHGAEHYTVALGPSMAGLKFDVNLIPIGKAKAAALTAGFGASAYWRNLREPQTQYNILAGPSLGLRVFADRFALHFAWFPGFELETKDAVPHDTFINWSQLSVGVSIKLTR